MFLNNACVRNERGTSQTVHVVSPDEHTRCEEATLHEGANSSYQTGITVENAPSTVVAEWQRRMRVGSCASILVSKEDGADAKAAAICKHLEKFVNAVIRVQREERDRQSRIIEEKLAKRNERRLAKGKHRRRSTAIKRDKSSVKTVEHCVAAIVLRRHVLPDRKCHSLEAHVAISLRNHTHSCPFCLNDFCQGPRKSVMDFKVERLQTTQQKEKQMK